MSPQKAPRQISETLIAILDLFATLPDKQAQKDVALTLAHKAGLKIQPPDQSSRTSSKPAIKRG